MTVGGARPDSALIGRICDACVESLPVSGAAISAVLGDGQRDTVCATDTVASRIEDRGELEPPPGGRTASG